MSGSAVKDLRKQIRNVIKEQLPELLRMEMTTAILEDVRRELGVRLTIIETMVKNNLEQMNTRSEQVQQYMINQIETALYRNAEPIAKVDPLEKPSKQELSI